jgi:hypothetical protein
MINWSTCQRDFEHDGGLRDLYVHNVTIEQWRAIYDLLRAKYCVDYSVDNESQPLPAGVDEAFAIRASASPALYFRVGGIRVGCHFFWDSEIEFDIDPSEVTSQSALDDLLGFMRLVGDTIGRTVTLTRENDEQHPFITYDPLRNDFDHHG